ncbi:MAG TPA: RNA ligase, partial [Ktedonobacterales bacterium]|nr:RNA ligase [Ktedonobacterales bacterium]
VLTLLDAVRANGPDVRAYKALGNLSVAAQGELLLFNYTPLAVYTGAWNDVEVVSRGLIIHWPTATVAALPFPKFWNLNERPETRLETLPDGSCEITEKLDGSLGILVRLPDGPAVATRGSFASRQAQWATAHLRARHNLRSLPEDVTLLFEIVYPDNPDGPILRYGDTEALFLIGARRFDGHDSGYGELEALAAAYGFPLAPRFDALGIAELAPLAATYTGIEGWVVRFEGGLRVKVKTEEYLRLHRLVSNVSPGRIQEMLLQEGAPAFQAFVVNLPDEFQREAEAYAHAMLAYVDREAARLRAIFKGPLAPYAVEVRAQGPSARKAFALAVKAAYAADATYLFALLDGRDIRPSLLRAMDLAALESPAGLRRGAPRQAEL